MQASPPRLPQTREWRTLMPGGSFFSSGWFPHRRSLLWCRAGPFTRRSPISLVGGPYQVSWPADWPAQVLTRIVERTVPRLDPTTRRSVSIGIASSAGLSTATTAASAATAAPAPRSGERQPRVAPRASTIVTASTVSTALAAAAPSTSSRSPVIVLDATQSPPERDPRRRLEECQSREGRDTGTARGKAPSLSARAGEEGESPSALGFAACSASPCLLGATILAAAAAAAAAAATVGPITRHATTKAHALTLAVGPLEAMYTPAEVKAKHPTSGRGDGR